MEDNGVRQPVVVVGIDGSTQSGEALRWAAQYTTLNGGELHPMIVWDQSSGFGYFPQGAESLEREARQTLDRTIHKYLGDERPVGMAPEVRQGNPRFVLVDASATADLLVVGDRGYGGFVGLLLGSVGESCVRHAKCSVVVVRPTSP
jgi:nucleotide-binding universal stress UspA family protein